tara:strand:- start:305 stop:589 length:285 start_codon:yes stop_codon:yes gene_type:complete
LLERRADNSNNRHEYLRHSGRYSLANPIRPAKQIRQDGLLKKDITQDDYYMRTKLNTTILETIINNIATTTFLIRNRPPSIDNSTLSRNSPIAV